MISQLPRGARVSTPSSNPREPVAASASDASAPSGGPRADYEGIFARYAPRVLGYLQRRGLEPTAAEEVTQEVMLTVWRKAASYDPARASIATWVFAIARNKQIDLRRKRRRPEPDPDDPCFARAEAAVEGRPDVQLAADQRSERVRRALDALTPEQRETLTQLYFEGHTMAEVADRSGVALGTVKSRSRRALHALRQQLDGEEGSDA